MSDDQEVGMSEQGRVVIGMDPHKRSVTIEVMTADEGVVGGGRFATDVEGYRQLLSYVASWSERVWAIEVCRGIGRHIAHRLIADDQEVVDVPPELSARARVFSTGQGRKTDATGAHSVAPGRGPDGCATPGRGGRGPRRAAAAGRSAQADG